MNHYFTKSIILALVVLSNCVVQYTSQKKEEAATVSGVSVAISDNVISVNGESILAHPMFFSRNLAHLSGREEAQEKLIALLDSLRKKEFPESDSTHKKKSTVSVNAELYTQYLIVYNSITACGKATFGSARLSVNEQGGDTGEISLPPPDPKDQCAQMICRVDRFSVKLVAGSETLFQIPYRAAYRYRTPSKPEGIITKKGLHSEVPPSDPKTGERLWWGNCMAVMLYRSDDTLDTPLTDEITRELLQYKKRRKECARAKVLAVGARTDISIGIISQVIQAVQKAGYEAVYLRKIRR